MATCRIDPGIGRVNMEGFEFPLGVYPVEPMTPRAGYTVQFEPADGSDDEGDLEEWPDRYMFDAVVPAGRLETLVRTLLFVCPARVYPILDVLGHDGWRESDPYVSYDLIGLDRFQDSLRQYAGFFFEDGMCGFGVMSEEPYFYLFVDEHKIVTVRVEPDMKERIEKVLRAFDLEAVDDPAGADSAAHEHRSVLLSPDEEPDWLCVEEIVERLKDDWKLLLNVDPHRNVDEDGNDLGVTAWRCLVRYETGKEGRSADGRRYAEVILGAACLADAEEAAVDAVAEKVDDAEPGEDGSWGEADVVFADRVTVDRLRELIAGEKVWKGTEPPSAGEVVLVRLLP